MNIIERLRDKANSLPTCPGVYIMKNSDGQIIYVGKSKKLKNRVSSYFSSKNHTGVLQFFENINNSKKCE